MTSLEHARADRAKLIAAIAWKAEQEAK
jgi:hypothetical protein